MKRPASLLISCLLLGFAIAPFSPAQQSSERAWKADEPEGYGLLLTPAVMDKLLDRVIEKMGQDLKFDEAQSADAQRVFKENVLKFIKQNQKELTQLANEFLDKRLGTEPPTAEEVAEWAKRASPMLEKTRELVTHVSEQMREFMTDEQQVKMDASLAAFEVGTGFVGRRLASWSEGGFDPATDWPRNPGVQKLDREQAHQLEIAMKEARDAKLNEGRPPAAAPQIVEVPEPVVPVTSTPDPAARAARAAQPTPAPKAEPKDEWTLYVESYIARYSLDSTQAQKAMVFLNTATGQRDSYLRSKGKQMEQTEKSFKAAATPAAVKTAEEQYQKLMQPVERMFSKLKESLDGLPTRDQRRKASDATLSEPATPKKPAAAAKP